MNKELRIKKQGKGNTTAHNSSFIIHNSRSKGFTLTPMSRCDPRKRGGFTIVELLVSTGLFVILVSLASSSFIQALRTQRIVTNLSISMNDASFVIEQIAREVRVGFNFNGGGSTFNFTNPGGYSVSYSLSGTGIWRCEGGSCDIITSPDVKIDNLGFILQGNAPGDGEPPRVTILISIVGEKEIKVHLQTTISSRILDT